MSEQQIVPTKASSPITAETQVIGGAPQINFRNLRESTATHEKWLTEHPDQLTTPTGLQSRIQLAELLRLQHKRADARALARGVLRDDDRNPRAHTILGTIAVQDKEYATATEHFQQSLEANPNQQGAVFFLQTPKQDITSEITRLEAITERTDDQKRYLALLRLALDYKNHENHTKEDDRLAEEARQFIVMAQSVDDPFKIIPPANVTDKGVYASMIFRDMKSWLQTRHAEPIDQKIQAQVIKVLRDVLGPRADQQSEINKRTAGVNAVTRFVSEHQSSLYQIHDQDGYYRALLEAYGRITNINGRRRDRTVPVTDPNAITEELIPEIRLQTIVPDILKIQYDTVSGSEIRNNKNGNFVLDASPLALDRDDIYHVATPDPQLSRAENVFAELLRHTKPDESQKEYLFARNPDAIPPVMQIAKKDQAGHPEITTIIFKNLESYNQFLQLITEQKKSQMLQLLNEKTTPQENEPEPDELDKVFHHDTSETIAPPISVNATPIKNGEIVADGASAQRQTLLEKSFPEFPPDNVYFVLSDWITPDQQNVMKLTIGGKIFPPRHDPDKREFFSLDVALPKVPEEDAKLLLGDLLQGGSPAEKSLQWLLEQQPDINADDIPKLSIRQILEPRNHVKAHGVNWFWMEPAHLLLNDVLRHFPEIPPETQDEPERWEDRLDPEQQKILGLIRRRPQKPLRGRKKRAHVAWIKDLVATPPDLTIEKAPSKELEDART